MEGKCARADARYADSVLRRVRPRRIGSGAAVVPDAELVEHHGRDDRGEVDDPIDVVRRRNILVRVEIRVSEGIAVLAAIVIVGVAEEDFLARGELVIHLLVPAAAAETAAAFTRPQLVGRPL